MRPLLTRSFGSTAALLLLVSCSGTGSQKNPVLVPMGLSSQSARPTNVNADLPSITPNACAKAKIYVADYAKNDVEFYPQGVTRPKPCGKITTGISGPEGIYVDAKGTLYVANLSTSTVTEYLRGKKTPSVTLATPASAFDVFVGRDGTLYVAEINNMVAEYAPGAITPTRSISINGGPHGVATDAHNNLYVSYLSNTDGVSHVEKFAPMALTGTDLGFTVSFSGEIKLDSQNDVVIGDRNNNDIVYIYPPGQIVPSRSFRTPAGNPVNFALNKAETLFYVSGFTQVQVIDFQTGAEVDSITSGLTSPSGVAAYPPAPY